MGAGRILETAALVAALLCAAPPAARAQGAPLYPSRLRIHALDPASAPISAWLDSRAQLHQQALEPRRHDVLVVPFQVQGYAVDAIERSLMTWALVDALEREGRRIANPEVVEHALGGPQYRHRASPTELGAFFELAIRMRVPRVVVAHAGHLLDGKLRISVRSFDLGPDGFPAAPSRTWDRDALPLSDTELPSRVFQQHLGEVVASVLGAPGAAAPQRPERSGAREPAFPASPEALVASPAGSPHAAALQLQLLASVHPPGRGRERLYERSLVALARVAPEAPNRALLEARAWWGLHRRPAAVAALATAPPGPEADALRALLDGNLDGSGRGLGEIRSPLLRFQARLEHRFLQRAYRDRTLGLSERALVAEVPEAWRPFVEVLLGASDASVAAQLALRLDEAFALPGFDARGQLAEDALHGRPWADERSLRLEPRRHFDRLLEVEREGLLPTAAYWRPHRADLLGLLVSASEEVLFAHLRALVLRDDPSALAQLEDYAGVYAEHPQLEAVRFLWLERNAKRAPAAERAQREQRARAVAERIHLWEGGQTDLTTRLPRIGLYDPDFPTHPDWYWPFETPELVGMEGRHGQVDGLWSIESHLAYTTASVASVEQLHARLSDAGQAQAVAELVKRNAHRFVGHPKRPRFLAGEPAGAAPPDESDGVAAATAAVERGVRDWSAYPLAAAPHLARGELSEAAAIYRNYPRFAREPERADEQLALHAWEAGSEFFWRGDAGLAAPFFAIAARAAPRSSAGLGGLFRLLLLEERWGDAANAARVRVAGAGGGPAIRDFVMMLHMLGAHAEAWALFERAALEMEDRDLWSAAFVGHRVEGRSDADVVAWLVDPQRTRTQGMLRHVLLFSLLQDRAPSADWPRHVRRVAEAVLWTMPDTREMSFTPEQWAELVGDTARADLAVVEFYAAWKRRELDAALALVRRGAIDLRSHTQLLPYAAWAASAAGGDAAFDALLAAVAQRWEKLPRTGSLDAHDLAMDLALARAVRHALRGEHAPALAELEAARHARAYTRGRLFFTWYQLLEICDALYRATGHEPYRALALDWARRHTRIQPMLGFAWALVAGYSDAEPERARALRAALFLDRRSALLDGVAPDELAAASRWLAEHTPFPAAGARESEQHAAGQAPPHLIARGR